MNPDTLENNRSQAESRDLKLTKSLEKKPEILQLFQQQIDEMVSVGILKKVELDYPRRYLPLLAVVNMDKESCKVRVCLDSKAKYKGLSFNDALLKGKIDMMDILIGLTRFRADKHALLGDIKRMFWQIRLSPKDVQFQGVIWHRETYVFTRVSFGGKNSPPIADYGI